YARGEGIRRRVERGENAVAGILDDDPVVLLDRVLQDRVVQMLELIRPILAEPRAGRRRPHPVGTDDRDEISGGHRWPRAHAGSGESHTNCSGRSSDTSTMTSAGMPARSAASRIASALGDS